MREKQRPRPQERARVIEKYRAEGWKVLVGGSPNFIALEVEGHKIVDHLFVKIVPPERGLTYEQDVYKKVLKRLGGKFKVEVVGTRPRILGRAKWGRHANMGLDKSERRGYIGRGYVMKLPVLPPVGGSSTKSKLPCTGGKNEGFKGVRK